MAGLLALRRPSNWSIAAIESAMMDNADFRLHWRKAAVRPFVAGTLRQLRGDDPASAEHSDQA